MQPELFTQLVVAEGFFDENVPFRTTDLLVRFKAVQRKSDMFKVTHNYDYITGTLLQFNDYMKKIMTALKKDLQSGGIWARFKTLFDDKKNGDAELEQFEKFIEGHKHRYPELVFFSRDYVNFISIPGIITTSNGLTQSEKTVLYQGNTFMTNYFQTQEAIVERNYATTGKRMFAFLDYQTENDVIFPRMEVRCKFALDEEVFPPDYKGYFWHLGTVVHPTLSDTFPFDDRNTAVPVFQVFLKIKVNHWPQ